MASADHLKRNGKRDKKVLFVVTDGEDNDSRENLEQAVKQLHEENGPAVYAIGILGDEEHPKRAKRALEVMAQRTGGLAFNTPLGTSLRIRRAAAASGQFAWRPRPKDTGS